MKLEDYLETDDYKILKRWAIRKAFYDNDKANDFVADFLVLKWADIVLTWDDTKCPEFCKWVFMSFRWNVLRDLTRSKRKRDRGTDIDAIVANNIEDKSTGLSLETLLNVTDIGAEQVELKELLQKLPPDLSYIVWNYSIGFTFEQIAVSLCISRATVHERFKGAIAALARLAGGE